MTRRMHWESVGDDKPPAGANWGDSWTDRSGTTRILLRRGWTSQLDDRPWWQRVLYGRPDV